MASLTWKVALANQPRAEDYGFDLERALSAVKASDGMMECSPTTAASARSRSNPKSSARGWIAGGTFHSVNESMRALRIPRRFYHSGVEREMTPAN